MTIEELKYLKESEDNIEFKEAKENFPWNGGSHREQKDRRKCYLGYIVALANEGGGYLVLGMADKEPHQVVGSDFANGEIGALEDAVYEKLQVRVHIEELFDENGLRVVLTTILPRPKGKTLKFEGVPLMRTGDSLRNMSDDEVFKILSEQEPDFSAKICEGLSFNDLDRNAISLLKKAYSTKQSNQLFNSLDNKQALSDIGLIDNNKITYAALILVGKKEAISKYLPQSTINLEYRNSLTQINFDNRKIFTNPYFINIENLWELINQRNGNIPVQQGPYIYDIPFFNKEVIREALNNAISHRDYKLASEIVIKQFPNAMHIVNPGGFPKGVNIDNLLTVNSTPRNRLLSDVMAKTGVVERSGQGVDKIFYQTVSEAKPLPDYSRSDNYQVELRLSAIVEDKAFTLFIRQIQQDRLNKDKLSVLEVITLNKIRLGAKREDLDSVTLKKLENDKLIQKLGKTKGVHYSLSKMYYDFTGEKGKYSRITDWDENQVFFIILRHLQRYDKAKMSDFVELFEDRLTRKQVRYSVKKLVDKKDLKQEGSGKSTIYSVGDNYINTMKILSKAIDIGIEEMRKKGEIE